MKLLDEKRTELKNIIKLRFGPSAWDEIISERANRINEVKEKKRQQRVQARKQRDEIMEILKWFSYALIGIGVIMGLLVMGVKAFAYEYKSKNLTRNQKINNGTIVLPQMTTCRLKKQKVYKDKMACIYQGANKTFELEFADIRVGCPKQYKCVLNENGSEPSIDKIMESLRSIAK